MSQALCKSSQFVDVIETMHLLFSGANVRPVLCLSFALFHLPFHVFRRSVACIHLQLEIYFVSHFNFLGRPKCTMLFYIDHVHVFCFVNFICLSKFVTFILLVTQMLLISLMHVTNYLCNQNSNIK